MRDRVMAILILGVFVMFFWAAFEQAGNVLNVWADKHTNRYLTGPAPDAERRAGSRRRHAENGRQRRGERQHRAGLLERFRDDVLPQAAAGREPGRLASPIIQSRIGRAWFQSINALAIFVLAPLFAWMWVWLDRRGWQPSIPFKMAVGLLMMSASMALMMRRPPEAKTGKRRCPCPPAGCHPVLS